MKPGHKVYTSIGLAGVITKLDLDTAITIYAVSMAVGFVVLTAFKDKRSRL